LLIDVEQVVKGGKIISSLLVGLELLSRNIAWTNKSQSSKNDLQLYLKEEQAAVIILLVEARQQRSTANAGVQLHHSYFDLNNRIDQGPQNFSLR
jgi:hypothetical protein